VQAGDRIRLTARSNRFLFLDPDNRRIGDFVVKSQTPFIPEDLKKPEEQYAGRKNIAMCSLKGVPQR
jgi:hypothetical protein